MVNPINVPFGGLSSAPVYTMSVWVTTGVTNPRFQTGILPPNAIVFDILIHVTEAFNSGTSDNIRVGHSTDNDAYSTDLSVQVTGVSSIMLGTITAGAGVGYDSTSRIGVDATLTSVGAAPTTGKAIVVVYYLIVPRTP